MRKGKKVYTRPRLYWQEGIMLGRALGRMRILYPDGSAEYSYDIGNNDWSNPCWNENSTSLKRASSLAEAIKYMKQYDIHYQTPAIFLGEL